MDIASHAALRCGVSLLYRLFIAAALLGPATTPVFAQSQQRQGGVTVLRGKGEATGEQPVAPPQPLQTPSAAPTLRAPPADSSLPSGAAPVPSAPVARPPTLPVGPPRTGLAPAAVNDAKLDGFLGRIPPLSDADAARLAALLAAADADRWDDVRNLAGGAEQSLLRKFADWLSFRSMRGDGDFGSIAAFLAANPDWPDESALRRVAEDRLDAGVPPGAVLGWFRENPPLTSAGLMKRLAAADAAAPAQVAALARESWREGTFRNADEAVFRQKYGGHLTTADTVARFDRLLREGKDAVAAGLLPMLPPAEKSVGEARLALMRRAKETTALLRALPPQRLQEDRLTLERIRYFRRTGEAAAAQALMFTAKPSAPDEDWWSERNALAREALGAGRLDDAYRLASRHGLSRSAAFADAEFLSGWISLRWLQRPQQAAAHFRTLEENVTAPISKSRAWYWLGRALEAGNEPAQAAQAYDRAAAYGQTYYGQLAAKKLPGGFARMPRDPAASETDRESLRNRELLRVARYLRQVGEGERAQPFIHRLSRLIRTAGELALSAEVALDLGRPDLAVQMARHGAVSGVVLHESAWPVVDLGATGPVERALALALVRQESNFSNRAVSPVGAQGLMQLMPDTARMMAGKLGAPYQPERLTQDPSYNVALGSQYLADQLQRFGGSLELAVAAYNAGPGRVERWLGQIGDPRGGQIDMVDWVELIPFNETRNYVQRVMEGLTVYRDRLNGPFRTIAPAGRRS